MLTLTSIHPQMDDVPGIERDDYTMSAAEYPNPTASDASTSLVLTNEEGKELVRLCRTGRLYEVEAWVASGKSLSVPSALRKTPLQVAVELGFHSLVRLLARYEKDVANLNQALSDSVALRCLDTVSLLLEHGADLKSVPLADVLLTWEPNLIQLFLAGGADVLEGLPFTVAFCAKVRTALRPFINFKRAHSEREPQLQEQLERALRHFACEGDLKWVSLLLWAGANPRSTGPSGTDEDDPDSYVSALEAAAASSHVEILKKLKLNRERDDLSRLLCEASFRQSSDVLVYLLELGARPNDRPNGGSSSLSRCLHFMRFERIGIHGVAGKRAVYSVSESLRKIRILAEHGAIWNPENPCEMNSLRRTLLESEPEVSVALFKIFVPNAVCSQDTWKSLFSSARFRQHLEKESWWLTRLKLRDFAVGAPGKGKERPASSPRISRQLMARYDREQLYRQVWEQPMQKLAKEYGISDVALSKTCRKLLVPVPGRGFWAKKEAGVPLPKRPRLPSLG